MTQTTALYAGASSLDITPLTPQWLDGFGARTRPSEGVHLPISVKAIACSAGAETAMLISAEVLAFDRDRYPALKRKISDRTGIPTSAIAFAATHTHCAPRVCEMVMPGAIDRDYVEFFEGRCLEAALLAREAFRPAVLRFSRTKNRFGTNRRVLKDGGITMAPNPQGPQDRDVDTLWFEAPDSGKVIATVTVVGCHPTSVGWQLISGDYPGVMMAELERVVGGPSLFLLGCAGDVRPNFATPEGKFRMATREELEATGRELAADILAARNSAAPRKCMQLTARAREFEMPLANLPDEEALRHTAANHSQALIREWAERLLSGATPRVTSVPFEMQMIRFEPGPTLVLWPGEVASEYALTLKSELASAGSEAVMAAAYANGAVGYVPSQAMYPLGGYEVNGSHYYYNLPAPYAQDVETRLLGETRALLNPVD